MDKRWGIVGGITADGRGDDSYQKRRMEWRQRSQVPKKIARVDWVPGRAMPRQRNDTRKAPDSA